MTAIDRRIEEATFSFREKEEQLRNRFSTEAIVEDSEKGIVIVRPLNRIIDMKFVDTAAELIAEQYRRVGKRFDCVTGIQYSGALLAGSLGRILDIPVAASRKDIAIPRGWDHAVPIDEGTMLSHTTGMPTSHVFNIPPGEVLIADDVLAEAKQSVGIIKYLQGRGRKVELAVMMEKIWQGGGDVLRSETEVNPVHAIGVEKLEQVEGIWRPVLSAPHFS